MGWDQEKLNNQMRFLITDVGWTLKFGFITSEIVTFLNLSMAQAFCTSRNALDSPSLIPKTAMPATINVRPDGVGVITMDSPPVKLGSADILCKNEPKSNAT